MRRGSGLVLCGGCPRIIGLTGATAEKFRSTRTHSAHGRPSAQRETPLWKFLRRSLLLDAGSPGETLNASRRSLSDGVQLDILLNS